ncbi:MAG: hypothetical protein WC661_13800 [Opitutaceae bacterium]|jgi:hypothetical protein
MKTYLYLTLLPEALVASHLPPEEYGAYLAIGTQKRARGQALFFKLSDAYAAQRLAELGVSPTLDRPAAGPLRHSAYLSVYRVLESIPITALESLHLITEDGRNLTLKPGTYEIDAAPRLHLYQEFCPVTPRVVSTLDPKAFAAHITDLNQRVALPALVFAELKLERLAENADAPDVDNLPYPNMPHLRDCLREFYAKPGKSTKTVIRFLQQDVLYRTLRKGFYVAVAGGGFAYFPMPSKQELETTHYTWWRSALSTFGG